MRGRAKNALPRQIGTLALAVVASELLLAGTAWASSPFDLTWYTVDGGGGVSSGGVYSLTGAVGQPDAGALSGGVFTLSGGFFAGAPFQIRVGLPLVVR